MADNSITTSLEYKNHESFFHKMLEYKSRASELLAMSYSDKNKVIQAYEIINALYLYTSNYIYNHQEIRAKLKEILNLIQKNRFEIAVNLMEDLLTEISNKHEDSDLLPKKKTESKPNEYIWRSQNDRVMREIAKGCADYLFKS